MVFVPSLLMAADMSQVTPESYASEYQMLTFLIKQMIAKTATAMMVKVISCTNSGGLSAAGTVNVQPMVNQMTGDQTPVSHGVLYSLPYLRIQGGTNGIIIDPQTNDIGLAVFCSRDISNVKVTKSIANPGSARQYDWADGVYICGWPDVVPQSYVQFESNGAINIFSTSGITLTAPTINLNGATISGSGNITDGAGTVLHTHVHTGVMIGSSDTGPPA